MKKETFMKKLFQWRPGKKAWIIAAILLVLVIISYIVFPWISGIVTGILLMFSGKGKNAAEKYIDGQLAENEQKRKEAEEKAAADRKTLEGKKGEEAHDAAGDILRD